MKVLLCEVSLEANMGHILWVVNIYKRYAKEHKFWFIKLNEYKNLMFLNDNWKKRYLF